MLRLQPYILCFLLSSFLHTGGQVITIEPVSWNSEFNEFAPAIYGEEIVYCTDRPSQFGVKWLDESGNQPIKIYRSGPPSGKQNVYLNTNINSHFNEGPACFNSTYEVLYYTGTISGSNRKEKSVLGIFTCAKTGAKWTEAISFAHNSVDATYNIAHPMISQDGQTLYFASDMPGSKGGLDIFYCKLTEAGWGQPINMGELVNTPANECYPFQDEFSNFFFSSDRNPTSGLDIFQCKYHKDNYLGAVALGEPMNSSLDDFGYVSTNGGELGYFSSNRNSRGDDIFKFAYTYPAFEACPPAEQPTFCYYFEETSIVPNDSMKFIYEWELGDGSTSSGLSTEHCYQDFGSYHIALNVYDSITRVKFARVSELDLKISKSPFPWITAADAASVSAEVLLSAAGTDIADFDCREYYWYYGDGRHSRGYSTTHQFSQDGVYEVQLGIIGINTITQTEEKRCSTKKIKVGASNQNESLAENAPVNSTLQTDMVFMPEDSTEKLTYMPDSTLYYVQFHESKKQLALDDPFFDNIKYEITERTNVNDTTYKYSVGNTTDVNVMFRIYNDLIDKGYFESLIKEIKADEFAYTTTKKWWYFADSLASEINQHLNKFNDIQFNKDDFRIREASYDNLDYIAQVLLMEPEMKLKITAHTDSIGSAEHNMKLSIQRAQEVLYYFVKKGIDANRLTAIGCGEEIPLLSNSTEEGRSVNRRVSFEIVLKEKPKG